MTQNPDAPLILVVEDDDNHAELIKRSFESAYEEYRLDIVGSLQTAREAIERNLPSLVLTDYRLPDGYGSELVTFANDNWSVILMTSQGNEQLAVEAMKAGAQDYVVKSPEAISSMSHIVGLALREWNLIKERKTIYRAVSRGKREWEQTFDAVPDLIAIIDQEYSISRVNRAMAERCGLNPEEMVGRKCYDVVHGLTKPPDFCQFATMMQVGLQQRFEMDEQILNGSFDVTVTPLCEETGQITACVHVARDITERIKSEKERWVFEQQLQQTQKLESLGVLAGGIAHDFNNILTIILGHCYISMEEINSGITNKSHLQQIEVASNRAAELCRQMLAYAGKSPLVQTQVNMWLLVDDIVKMLQSVIQKSVHVELDLKRDIPDITGDASQIQQIVMNLIINASEAIGDNKGTIRVELEKVNVPPGSADATFLGNPVLAGSYALLQVSDDGCGMDEETQKRIFEPFYTTKFTGRGLGMSAVLGIIKSHNGAINISSQTGVGTTFKVYFPLSNKSKAVEEIPLALTAPDSNSKILDEAR